VLSLAIALALGLGLSAPAQVTVTGRVTDESGSPVSGAEVRVLAPSAKVDSKVVTDAGGLFSASIPPVAVVSISASHSDFGLQFTSGADIRVPAWTGFRYAGAVPTGAIDLRLRRGVVLRGRVVDPSGRPFAGDSMFYVPRHNGSGPPRHQAETDQDGRFEFERMVLNDKFELVPHGLDFWHPRVEGSYFRVVQAPESWLAAAASGRPIDLQLQAYRLVTLTLDVSAMRVPNVQVWTRSGSEASGGAALEVENGRVRIAMEQGVAYQLWVVPGTGRNMVAPWTRGINAQWAGTVQGPLTLRIGG
jgi:hypothetical protein